MKEFRVELSNKPGQLARMGQALGMHGVGIRAIASVSRQDISIFALVTDNDGQTRAVLKELGLHFQEAEVLTLPLMDHAGELGRFAKQLGDAGVNIDSLYLLNVNHAAHEVEIAFTVDDAVKARKALGLR
ncbi:MAG TPA: hypothetical protein VIL47_06750 [Candidatus Bipolaricaulota bacterium]